MTPHNAKNNNESSSESEKEENVEEYKNILFKEQHVLYTGPKKTLNILVLGETGVGKSTFINATANYMSFDTLDDALEAPKPICLIPSKFTHWETSTKSIEVTLESSHGEKDENELFTKKSQSQTQATKTYQFETSKYIINIMDSPGIGDARGLEQDQENMINILNALGQHEDLHAICLLFKANEPKLTQTMSYCIGELLLRLHKDAINNIFFFFTNSRVTDYSIGDTSLPLQAFFSELFNTRGIKIPFEPENICCTDNESFCLICAYHCGANFTEEEFNAYATSWKQSATETHRFIEFAARKSSHQVADTLAVNKIRTIILCLAKPLATINELIESNIKVINDKKRELHNTANDLNELKKKLKITLIGMEIKPLNYPKTVCTAASCVEHQMLPGTEQYKTHYKQVCHDHCFLKNVEVEKVEDPNLKGCSAMAGQLNCRVCEHSWKEHMHIRFDQFKTTIEVEDKITKTQIKSNQDASVLKNQMIENHENSIKELKAEQKKIMESSLRFGKFLDDNAILPYNDAFEEYVGKTISEEKNCVAAGGDRSKLDNMQKFLAEYRAQKMILKKAKKEPGVSGTITPDEIAVIKTELYDLPRYGQLLKDLFEATEDGIAKHVAHTTVKYTPPIAKNQTHYGERKATKKEKTK
uniref:G domain-containing protein n=1 Tax=Panagrolaimus davidi TaxID=227884 RepID=A0A914QB10_9BILA